MGCLKSLFFSHMKLTHFLPVYIFLLMMLCTQLIFTLLYTHFPGVNEKGPGLKGFEENCLTMQKCKAITFYNVSTFTLCNWRKSSQIQINTWSFSHCPMPRSINHQCSCKSFPDAKSAKLQFISLTLDLFILTTAHCLKITQNVAFQFFNFGIFHQFSSFKNWPIW